MNKHPITDRLEQKWTREARKPGGVVYASDCRELEALCRKLARAYKVSLARAFAAGYHGGHEDTVEGCYVHVLEVDLPSYFMDRVETALASDEPHALPEATAALAEFDRATKEVAK